jgi:hypothetical protein
MRGDLVVYNKKQNKKSNLVVVNPNKVIDDNERSRMLLWESKINLTFINDVHILKYLEKMCVSRASESQNKLSIREEKKNKKWWQFWKKTKALEEIDHAALLYQHQFYKLLSTTLFRMRTQIEEYDKATAFRRPFVPQNQSMLDSDKFEVADINWFDVFMNLDSYPESAGSKDLPAYETDFEIGKIDKQNHPPDVWLEGTKIIT